MGIEYGDKSKIEQQKLEQKESDQPKTGKDALDFLKQQKIEDKKEAKEGRETPELRQESFSGKQSLDIVAQERQALKAQKQEGISPNLGGMDDGDKGGKGENAQEIDLTKEKIKISEGTIQQEPQKLAAEKSKLSEQERQKQIDDLLRKGF